MSYRRLAMSDPMSSRGGGRADVAIPWRTENILLQIRDGDGRASVVELRADDFKVAVAMQENKTVFDRGCRDQAVVRAARRFAAATTPLVKLRSGHVCCDRIDAYIAFEIRK